jgi:hypothetical protein
MTGSDGRKRPDGKRREGADARSAENPRFAWILRYDFVRIAVATGAAGMR